MKKFEDSIMISGWISFSGLSKLIFLDGIMNSFSYSQTFFFFKEDIEDINKKSKVILIIEIDGSPAHKSKNNINLLNAIKRILFIRWNSMQIYQNLYKEW